MSRRFRCLRAVCLALPLALLLALSSLHTTSLPVGPASWRALSSAPTAPLQPSTAGAYACSLHRHPASATLPVQWPPCDQDSPEALEALLLRHYTSPASNATRLSGPAALLHWPRTGWTPGTVHRAEPPSPTPSPSPHAQQGADALPPPPPPQLGCLALGHRHTLRVQALDAAGAPVHTSGSYLEARLEGASVRYRPRVKDQGNGEYLVEVLLPDDAALRGGAVALRLVHLYSRWAGLTFTDGYYYARPDELVLEAHFALAGAGQCGGLAPEHARQPPLQPPTASCSTLPFAAQPFWEGHWLRLPEAPGHQFDRGPPLQQCPPGACTGDARGLWTRWVYRLGGVCHFHLFSLPQARRCLNGSHLWGSGDSNWVDSQRNLLTHILGLDVEGWLVRNDFVLHGKSNDMAGSRWRERSEEHPQGGGGGSVWGAQGFTWADFSRDDPLQWGAWNVGTRRPLHPPLPAPDAFNMSFRLGGIYNGAPQDAERNFGLATVYHSGWRGRHAAHWAHLHSQGQDFPTAMVMNSGLHDGLRFFGHPFVLKDYVMVSRDMVGFWEELRNKSVTAGAVAGVRCAPRMYWKHTVAPAGGAREMKSNPQKMEVYNRLMAGRILEGSGGSSNAPRRLPRLAPGCSRPFQVPIAEGGAASSQAWQWLDIFDMTFPFHYDNAFSDGGHYGRWSCDGSPQRRCDSVDLMVLHVLLNSMCSREEVGAA